MNTGVGADASDPLTALQQERDELHDRLLRTTAEFDNYRKRTDRERRELSDAVAADLVRDVLPVDRRLERALAAPASDADAGLPARRRADPSPAARCAPHAGRRAARRGRPGLRSGLARGRRARPATDGRRDGEITAEIRRGYRIGQRLLRPAQVKVAKA